jgi:polar amino acid transport system substrate-binding protein
MAAGVCGPDEGGDHGRAGARLRVGPPSLKGLSTLWRFFHKRTEPIFSPHHPNGIASEFSRAAMAPIRQNDTIAPTTNGPRPMPEKDAVAELAPTGVLRAAINMGNFLLVTGKMPSGDPVGVAPDMAREIAQRLGVTIAYVPYARPGELADAAGTGAWDIGLIGAEPQRAEKIAFTAAYVEIEATYLVPAGSAIRSVADVDQSGRRLAVTARSAYGLWLENNYKKGELIQFDNAAAALEAFDAGSVDAYAGLRPGLIDLQRSRPGSGILDGKFTSVQQAVGTVRTNTAGAVFLRDFVEEAKRSGLVARLIERHGVVGRLSVAPLA